MPSLSGYSPPHRHTEADGNRQCFASHKPLVLQPLVGSQCASPVFSITTKTPLRKDALLES